jgi:glutamate synthase domain-containing protein 2
VCQGNWSCAGPGAFRPQSVVNISAMSFGSLSGNAVEALNRGAVLAGCLHNTGEGGISRYHRHGGDWSSKSAPPTSVAATPRAASI